MHSYINAL